MMFPLESNPNIKSTVLNFIGSNRIPHAIMIEGDSAEDKKNLAGFLACAAVCSDSVKPCGKCKDCHMAQTDNHPDITYAAVADGKKNLTVDQIRKVRADAFVKPHSAEHRVFIIEDAHRMNEQAQNALLKVLEEPPAAVVFILTTNSKTFLLDTIVSRCVLLSLKSSLRESGNYDNMAGEFLNLLVSGSEYDMLKLLTPLEKNRTAAEEFISALGVKCTEKLCSGSSFASVFDTLYDDTKYYSDLLKTNINMPLFISTVVCRSKGLLNKR